MPGPRWSPQTERNSAIHSYIYITTRQRRRLNCGALHAIIQSWNLTFPDMARLDAQLHEGRNSLDQGAREIGMERLLGCGAARARSQWRRVSAAGPSLAFLEG